ncbi:YsnF/AvaK domain-containing protein [Peterkaempfera sp. SMS 1(5)a]|uniref:YsnF/AvaK domain-containing protein n=1 Tax=Peterkaempfera podocarpi TaxID=3232308 RepID=UPI00366B0B6C
MNGQAPTASPSSQSASDQSASTTRLQEAPTVEVSRAQPHTMAQEHLAARPVTAEHTHAAPRFAEADAQSMQSTPVRRESPSATHPGPSQLDVVCREERVEVTTEWHVLGTARLRKYVVTEEVERRIPVVRERVRVERVPVSEADLAGLSEKEISEAVEEVTLREERPVVRKRMVPVERVRLIVERVTHEEVVRTQLRREQVKVHDGPGSGVERTELGGGANETPHMTQYNGSGAAQQLEQPIA